MFSFSREDAADKGAVDAEHGRGTSPGLSPCAVLRRSKSSPSAVPRKRRSSPLQRPRAILMRS